MIQYLTNEQLTAFEAKPVEQPQEPTIGGATHFHSQSKSKSRLTQEYTKALQDHIKDFNAYIGTTRTLSTTGFLFDILYPNGQAPKITDSANEDGMRFDLSNGSLASPEDIIPNLAEKSNREEVATQTPKPATRDKGVQKGATATYARKSPRTLPTNGFFAALANGVNPKAGPKAARADIPNSENEHPNAKIATSIKTDMPVTPITPRVRV